MNGAIGGNSRILTLIILLTLPLPLQAEEQAQEQAEKQAQQQEISPTRKRKSSLQVGLELYAGAGGVLGFTPSKSRYTIELYKQTVPLNNLLWGGWGASSKKSFEGSIVGSRVRFFGKKSFNFAVGVFYRDLTTTTLGERNPSTGERSILDSENKKTFHLEFRIGHQWRWKHTYLGFDWVGWGIPDQPILLRPNFGILF